MIKKFSKIYKNVSNVLIGIKRVENGLEKITNGVDMDFPEIGVRSLPEYQEARDSLEKYADVAQEMIDFLKDFVKKYLDMRSNQIKENQRTMDSLEKYADVISNKTKKLDQMQK